MQQHFKNGSSQENIPTWFNKMLNGTYSSVQYRIKESFHLISDENKTLPIKGIYQFPIHTMFKMAHSSFSKGSFDKKMGPMPPPPPPYRLNIAFSIKSSKKKLDARGPFRCYCWETIMWFIWRKTVLWKLLLTLHAEYFFSRIFVVCKLFFKINFQKSTSRPLPECKTVWIEVGTDILSLNIFFYLPFETFLGKMFLFCLSRW